MPQLQAQGRAAIVERLPIEVAVIEPGAAVIDLWILERLTRSGSEVPQDIAMTSIVDGAFGSR
jgi:hypothetical protein